MAEVAQARVQEAVNSLVQEVDKSCLRKMQAEMHRCAADCCDQSSPSMEDVHRCIESCSSRMKNAQTFVQNELNNYQDRIQRCVMQCQDQIRDEITPNTTESEIGEFKKQFELCVVKCADTHIELVPSMLKRMKEMLNSEGFIKETA